MDRETSIVRMYGNTCRSPLAEGIFRLEAGKRGLAVEVRSAGTMAVDGLPVSGHTADILAELGASVSASGSSELTAELVEWADLILTMTMSHKQQLLALHPSAVDKTYTLKEYAEAGDSQSESIVREQERLTSELQIKQALGEPVTESERAQLYELERQAPSYDIADPFGGHMQVYRRSAAEIERAIIRVLDKMSGR